MCQYFREDGSEKSEGSYDDDKKIGEWKYFNNNGNLLSIRNYKDGLRTGE